MGTKRDPKCSECNDDGYILDYLGGCGDPECCGGPVEVKCPYCDNDWMPEDE